MASARTAASSSPIPTAAADTVWEDGGWGHLALVEPYKFYQYFFSVPDVDVIRFMKILTFVSLDEIQELEESMKKPGYVPNTVQRRLAEEVTRFVHGEEGLEEASKAAEALQPGAQTHLDSPTIEGIPDDVLSCSSLYASLPCLVWLFLQVCLLASQRLGDLLSKVAYT